MLKLLNNQHFEKNCTLDNYVSLLKLRNFALFKGCLILSSSSYWKGLGLMLLFVLSGANITGKQRNFIDELVIKYLSQGNNGN